MGTLYFVGVGLFDERDLPHRSLEELAKCRTLFAEEYTSTLAPGSWARLGQQLGQAVELLERPEVEDPRRILDALADPDRSPVGFLTAGDPFAATTHVALRIAAEEAGHSWQYRPNASVLTAAAGFLGLMPYRFGRPVSLPFPDPRFQPTSPLEGVRSNRNAGLHTLVLLDLRPAEGRFLTAGEAFGLLDERDPSGAYVPTDGRWAVVARLGAPDTAAWVGTRTGLQGTDFGAPLHVLVALAPTLHFEEEAALRRFRASDRARGRPEPHVEA